MALKDFVSEMHDMLSLMVDGIDNLYVGFLHDNLKITKEVETSMAGIDEQAVKLAEKLVEEAKTNKRAASYVSVPSHIERIHGNMERIAVGLHNKIKDNVLFSDKAIVEIQYLFERSRDIILHCKDMVLARNVLVAMHIVESQKALARSANEYSTSHEERLIEGLCTPKASGIYLVLIDAFKDIAWHAKGIAEELGK